MNYYFKITVLVSFLSMFMSCQDNQESLTVVVDQIRNDSTLFTLKKLSSSETGIHFNNQINEAGMINPFTWNFMYQGAGVGIGDINNDGKPDLYFCGNFVKDKIYLNKGNLKFEDISLKAGVEDDLWSTGVTMADVNGDGLLDIYVCKNAPFPNPEIRRNKLFINKGNGSFVEKAQEYGIDDDGFSVQASFFDFDNDGDLDMYLVNQPVDDFAKLMMSPSKRNTTPFSDKLYINENNRFTDKYNDLVVPKKAFGLSVLATDVDQDGYIDLYVNNDYHIADRLLINKSGTHFKDELSDRFNHISMYCMGGDAGDIDNDGNVDYMSLDMSFGDHLRSKTNMKSMQVKEFWEVSQREGILQYPKNMLQINNGKGYFNDISHFAGVESTDWSWASLFVDLNDDSYVDLLVSNGMLRDVQNNDWNDNVKKKYNGVVGPQNIGAIMEELPSTPIANFAYINTKNFKFKNISTQSGFDTKGFSNGMSYGDLDGDGDMDIVINNINAEAGIYENTSETNNSYINISLKGKGKNTFGYGARVVVYKEGKPLTKELITSRGYMSSVQPILHFGLGSTRLIDSIITYWDHEYVSKAYGIKADQSISFDFKGARKLQKSIAKKQIFRASKIIDYTHRDNQVKEYKVQVLLPHGISNEGPFMTLGDFDHDSFTDVFIGGAVDQSHQLFMQKSNGKFLKSDDISYNAVNREDMESAYVDLDGDNQKELYVVSGGNQYKQGSPRLKDQVYSINNGKLKSIKANLPDIRLDGKVIAVGDVNGDGQEDLFLGSRGIADQYPKANGSKLLVSKNGKLKDQSTMVKGLEDLGMVTDALFVDIDGDRDQDLVVIGEWMPITIFENTEGKFSKLEVDIFDHASTGLWWSIAKGDFDKDGDIDLLIGNLGENNKFHPSPSHPFYIYADDFDQNQSIDIVLAKEYKNNIVPVRGRECSSQQMPFILDKYDDYNAYAHASLEQIYTEKGLNKAEKHKIFNLSSIFLENLGELKFKARRLPAQLQFGPIKDFLPLDVNGDGNLDFVFGGGHNTVEVETVRYDGSKGGLVLGDGNNGFEYIPSEKSGLYFNHDVRDLDYIKIKDKYTLLCLSNNGPLETYSFPSTFKPDR